MLPTFVRNLWGLLGYCSSVVATTSGRDSHDFFFLIKNRTSSACTTRVLTAAHTTSNASLTSGRIAGCERYGSCCWCCCRYAFDIPPPLICEQAAHHRNLPSSAVQISRFLALPRAVPQFLEILACGLGCGAATCGRGVFLSAMFNLWHQLYATMRSFGDIWLT